MKYLLIVLLMLTGCQPRLADEKIYTAIINGNKITCSSAKGSECGVNMYNCDDGAEYYCVLNVREVKINARKNDRR